MGRTKGVHLHTAAKVLIEKYPDLFSSDYEHNKRIVKQLALKLGLLKESKEEQYKLAGELTTLSRRERPAAPAAAPVQAAATA